MFLYTKPPLRREGARKGQNQSKAATANSHLRLVVLIITIQQNLPGKGKIN